MFIVIKGFSGQVSGRKDEIIELKDKAVIKELLRAGYIAEYNSWGDGGYNQCAGGHHQTHTQKLTQIDIDAIIHRLRTSFDTLQTIANDYGVGLTTMYNINVGTAYRQENTNYPIRQKLIQIRPESIARKNPKCTCGAPVNRLGNRCKMCNKQAAISKSQKSSITLPPVEFAKKIIDNGFEAVGREYNVSGKTIAHWCQYFGIPSKKKELKKWYEEQML